MAQRPTLCSRPRGSTTRLNSRLAEGLSLPSRPPNYNPHTTRGNHHHTYSFQPTLFKCLVLQVSKSKLLVDRTPAIYEPEPGKREKEGSRACSARSQGGGSRGPPWPSLTKGGVLISASSMLHDIRSQEESGVT